VAVRQQPWQSRPWLAPHNAPPDTHTHTLSLPVVAYPYTGVGLRPLKRPGEDLHSYQHALLDRRWKDYRRALDSWAAAEEPGGFRYVPASGAYLWALRGHLRACHDLRSVRHPIEILEDLHAHLS